MSIHFPNQSRTVSLTENYGTKKEISTWQRWKKPVLFTTIALGTVIVVGALISAYGSSSSNPQPPNTKPKAKIDFFLPINKSQSKGIVTSVGMTIEWWFTPENYPSCYRVCHELKNTAAKSCATTDWANLADFLCSMGDLDSNGCDQIVQLVNQDKSRLQDVYDIAKLLHQEKKRIDEIFNGPIL